MGSLTVGTSNPIPEPLVEQETKLPVWNTRSGNRNVGGAVKQVPGKGSIPPAQPRSHTSKTARSQGRHALVSNRADIWRFLICSDSGRRKTNCACAKCSGKSLCVHQRQRHKCKLCNGSSFCTHGKQKSRCVQCFDENTGGSGICKHRRERWRCSECKDE